MLDCGREPVREPAVDLPPQRRSLGTKMSPNPLGASVGYDDPASFRRIFKRGVGLSPSAYRKKFGRIAQIARPLEVR